MEWPELRVDAPPDHRLEQMTRIVAHPVNAWESRTPPTGKQIDGQREPVHLGE
jgi:hypothetical protein